jgi:hypothetical protein
VSLSPEAWTAVGVVVSAIAAAISTVGVARINATKRDVGEAREHAENANEAAVEARELARPTGNGYAAETTATLDRIERAVAGLTQQVEGLGERQVRTNAWLTRHLSDHARASLGSKVRPAPDPTDELD